MLRFTDSTTGALVRPGFASVDEMDDHMITQWNSVVKDDDIVSPKPQNPKRMKLKFIFFQILNSKII